MNDSDSANWSTQEELERLIELAPTAIRRQALQRQLMAMKASSQAVEKANEDVSLEMDSAKTENNSESSEQDNIPFKQTDEPVKQDDFAAEKVDVLPKQEDVAVEGADSTAPEIDLSTEQSHPATKEIDVLEEQVGVSAEEDDDSLKQQDLPVQQDHSSVEEVDVFVEQDDTTVEESGISVEHDDVTVEREDILSVKSDDAVVEKNNISPEQDNVYLDTVEVIDKQQDDQKTETVELSFEEDAVLKQGKQPDNFYVYMRRKSRFSPVKWALLSAAALLILIISLMLAGEKTSTEISESNIQRGIDSMAAQVEVFTGQIKRMFAQVKTMLLGADESTEFSAQTESAVMSGKFGGRDAMLKMYEAQSIALNALLNFDEFIELNGVAHSQQKVDVKNLLQSAQTQQRLGQYSEAAEFYRRVNAELERFMDTGKQFIAQKKATELARLNWESYRWQFYYKTQDLPLISEEMALIALDARINNVPGGQAPVSEQTLTEYRAIENRYIKLLSSAEKAIKARVTVEPVRQQWHQLRDEHNLDESVVNDIEQHYILAVELEAAGDFQKAVEGYKLAGDSYTKALAKFR